MLTKGYSCAEAGRKKETEMKLGFITSILEDFTYEEMIDFASEHGFECVEVASWKKEKAERRYAGVSLRRGFLAMTVMPHIFQDTRKKKM